MSNLNLSSSRRFYTNLSQLCEVIIDIISSIEKKGYSPDISSFMLKLGKPTIIPNLTIATSDEDFLKNSINSNLSPQQYTLSRETLRHRENKQIETDNKLCLDMIETFISKSVTYWDQIKNKDMNFLLENSSVLFMEFPQQYVTNFCKIFKMADTDGKSLISENYIDEIWDFLHAMVRICIRHIHETRNPKEVEVVSKSDDGVSVKTKMIQYTVEYFPSLSVRKLVETWKVKMV